MTTAATVHDLTTTQAPFIEDAQTRGELFIDQPYALYSAANHATWRTLYAAMEPLWNRYAHENFLTGMASLSLSHDAIPQLDDVNRLLEPLSGFTAKAVSGYVPAYLFFDCLRRREFPTTITIRAGNQLDYLPEPDIFHDLTGHIPMYTDPTFADVLVRFGRVAHASVTTVRAISDPEERIHCLESMIKALARFFWFTVEFGLMRRTEGGVCVYGSGLLSSLKEIEYCVESPAVQRYPFQMEWVINQYFEIHHFQPLLFVIDSFEQLYEEVGRLETWALEGRLDHVSPGEPALNEHDLKSFLEAA